MTAGTSAQKPPTPGFFGGTSGFGGGGGGFGGMGGVGRHPGAGQGPNTVGAGAMGSMGGMPFAAPTPQQQEQQRQLQQRQFWEQELNMLREAYLPHDQPASQALQQQQPQLGMFASSLQPQQQPSRVVDYKFAFRVTDTSTGVPREVELRDRSAIEAKLKGQQEEMRRVQEHVERLGGGVKALYSQARAAKERLARCRDAHMELTNRFLAVLQRLQVLRQVNRPISQEEKQTKDRLESMLGRLEGAIRTLNEVGGVVEEDELDRREEPRQELTCDLAREDVHLLQQALEKQQGGLDFLTTALGRDCQGVELLKEKLDEVRAGRGGVV